MCGNPHELGEVGTHSLKVERGVKVLVLKIEIGRPGLKCFGHDMCLTLGNLGSNLVRLFFWRKNVSIQLHLVTTESNFTICLSWIKVENKHLYTPKRGIDFEN